MTAITAARPQLFIDAHEMAADDTFLFAVPAEPLNPHLPAQVHESWRALAADHAAAFDRDRVGFYTRSWNEVFYPGFFDIWPAYHGAVPVLYEQAATSGATVRLPNGRLRTYDEAIANVLRSAYANLATAAGEREQLLLRWWRARSSSAAGHGRAWLVLPDDTYKTKCITALLSTQSVRVEVAASECSASGLYSPWSDEPVELTLPKGTLLIRGAQPLRALVRNIFDFHVPLPAECIVRERQRIELGMKTSLSDVTAWSLPLAYGAHAYWTDTVPTNDWRAFGAETAADAVTSCEELCRGDFGYLYEDPSLHVTARLLARGVNVRVAREPFTLRDREWRAGTFLIRQEDQHADVLEILRDESRGAAEVVAVDSARILDGPDLGGQELDLLSAPSLGILAGPAMNAPAVGALRYVFDAKIGIAATLLDVSRLSTYDLSRYNVLLLGDTADGEAAAASLAPGVETLRHWLCCGGTLVAMSGGAQAVASTDITSCRLRSSVIQRHPPVLSGSSIMRPSNGDFPGEAGSASAPVVGPVIAPGARAFVQDIGSEPCDARLEPPASLAVDEDLCASLQRFLPRGAYVRADFRPHHWLRYGVADRLPVLFRETDVLIAGRSRRNHRTIRAAAAACALWADLARSHRLHRRGELFDA